MPADDTPPIDIPPAPPHQGDARERVMRDIMGYFRETRAEAGDALYLTTFDRLLMRYYQPQEKDAFTPAVEALAAQGLVARREGTIYLTPYGKETLDRRGQHTGDAEP